MSSMKALVNRSAEPGIWMENVPMPTISTNEVLIKVERLYFVFAVLTTQRKFIHRGCTSSDTKLEFDALFWPH